MKRLASVLLIFFLAVVPLLGESWWDNKPIQEIQFEGLIHVTPSDAHSLVANYIGKDFTPELFTKIQTSLKKQKNFSYFSAKIEPIDETKESSRIIFQVTELPLIEKIIVQGNSYFSDRDIRGTMSQQVGDILNRGTLRTDKSAIANKYVDKGFAFIDLDISVDTDNERKLSTVTVSVQEGTRWKIKDILFEGNTKASDSTLRRQLVSDERSIFSRGDFLEQNLELDMQAIEIYYQDMGYLDVDVYDVTTQLRASSDLNELTIIFFLDEGPQWYFGGIEFTGNTLYTEKELAHPIKHEIGDPLNNTKIQQQLSASADVYYDEGYIYNQIVPVVTRDNDKRTVSYLIKIQEFPKAIVGDIRVIGNNKTRDYVLLREVDLEVGESFSKSKLMSSLGNIYNTGLVTDVTSELLQIDDGSGSVIVNFMVEEKRTLVIGGAIGVSGGAGGFPLMAQINFGETNLAGRGQSLSTSLDLSAALQRFSFSFSDNWLFNRRLGYNSSISISHGISSGIYQDREGVIFTEDEYNNGSAAPDPYNSWEEYQAAIDAGLGVPTDNLMTYNSWEISLSNSLGYTWHTKLGRFSLMGGLDNTLRYITYDDSLYRPYIPTVRANLHSWKFKNVLWNRVAWDTRNYIFNPVKGGYVAQTTSYAGGILGGISHYLKSQTVGQAYIPLLSIQSDVDRSSFFHLVLVLKTNFTIMLNQLYRNNGEWISGIAATPDEKLIVDGMSMARGWAPIGGLEVVWDNSIELTMPLAQNIIWADFFFSGTGFLTNRSDILTLGIDDFRFSFGAGVRLVIPSFPFGFYFSKGFSYPNGEFQWKPGGIFYNPENPASGIDFTLTINMAL